jgi:hypothetical protein
MRAFLAFLVVSAFSFLSFRAGAQTPPPPPGSPFWNQGTRVRDANASDYPLNGLLGFELEVRAGVMLPDSVSPVLAPGFYPTLGGDPTGDILEGKEKPYSIDPFALSIAGGYRFLPFLSAGVFFDYANYQVNDGTDTGDYNDSGGGTTAWLERQMWQLGAYVRYYLTTLHPRLHPWVELGVGYSQDTASYTHGGTQQEAGQPLSINYYLSQQGVVTNGRLGLDVRLAPFFSIGPVLGYERVFSVSGCVDGEPQTDPQYPMSPVPVKNTCGAPVQANPYGVAFFGIFAKVTLFGPTLR